MIGITSEGIGFGNLSRRIADTDKFIISGSATGGLDILEPRHFATVVSYDFDKNCLTCQGLINASSESMTHAAVYESDSSINAVIHIHSFELWQVTRMA